VGWSQIPQQFTLAPSAEDLTLEDDDDDDDDDGDSVLNAIIDVAQANLTWYRNGIPLIANQLTTMLGNYVTQNDELTLEVSALVTVSSATGLPTTAAPVIYSNQYSLKARCVTRPPFTLVCRHLPWTVDFLTRVLSVRSSIY